MISIPHSDSGIYKILIHGDGPLNIFFGNKEDVLSVHKSLENEPILRIEICPATHQEQLQWETAATMGGF